MVLAFYTLFLTTAFFTTTLSLSKSTGTGTNLPTSNLSLLLLKLFKPVGTSSNLSMSNLSTTDFKLAKTTFLANFDASTPAAFLKFTAVA